MPFITHVTLKGVTPEQYDKVRAEWISFDVPPNGQQMLCTLDRNRSESALINGSAADRIVLFHPLSCMHRRDPMQEHRQCSITFGP